MSVEMPLPSLQVQDLQHLTFHQTMHVRLFSQESDRFFPASPDQSGNLPDIYNKAPNNLQNLLLSSDTEYTALQPPGLL